MTNHDDHLRDAELGPVIDRLRAERPTASALELDAIKQRVRGRVARSGRTESMRSRLAILGMLVLGMVLSTGGAGLAVSGFANPQGNAAQTQYGSGGGGGTQPQEEVLGEDDTGGGSGGPGVREDSGSPRVQPERQAELGVQDTGDEQLPFTGFAAIPVLVGGVALLGGGLVLRRRANS